jgi:hypothetical protein
MKRIDAANAIACTQQIWQPRVGRDLTREDARQIIYNVTGFFSLLAEWSAAEQLPAANDAAALLNPNDGEAHRDR